MDTLKKRAELALLEGQLAVARIKLDAGVEGAKALVRDRERAVNAMKVVLDSKVVGNFDIIEQIETVQAVLKQPIDIKNTTLAIFWKQQIRVKNMAERARIEKNRK